MIMRLYALYERNKKLLFVLLFSAALLIGVAAVRSADRIFLRPVL